MSNMNNNNKKSNKVKYITAHTTFSMILSIQKLLIQIILK